MPFSFAASTKSLPAAALHSLPSIVNVTVLLILFENFLKY
jgi:hypothetical protein